MRNCAWAASRKRSPSPARLPSLMSKRRQAACDFARARLALCQGGGGAGGAAGAGLRTCIPLTAEPPPNVSYRLAPGLDRATSLSSCEVECATAVLARRIEAMNTTGSYRSLRYQRGCNRRHAPGSDSIGPQRRDGIHANGSPRRHVGRQRRHADQQQRRDQDRYRIERIDLEEQPSQQTILRERPRLVRNLVSLDHPLPGRHAERRGMILDVPGRGVQDLPDARQVRLAIRRPRNGTTLPPLSPVAAPRATRQARCTPPRSRRPVKPSTNSSYRVL